MKNNAVLIIRFHYEENDKRFAWRFSYFKEKILPRILAQTYSNFDIAIRCNDCHKKLFEELSDRIITFKTKDDSAKYKKVKSGKVYFEDFVQWEDVIGLEKYDVQIGIDSDDLMGKDYVKLIMEEVAKTKESLHVHFQPRIIYLKTGQDRPMAEYGPMRGSAFMALYQPDKENYKFLYCQSHITLWRLAKKTVILPAGHCWATVHEINESTR